MGMASEEVPEPEGRIIGKDSETKTQTTICDEHKQQYFLSGYEAGKKDAYDEGYSAGRRFQAPRSYEHGVEIGRVNLKLERKKWVDTEVMSKRWAIDPETGCVVMTPELFGQMKTALSTVWDQAIARFRNCMEALDLSKPDDSPEARVREYMRNSFSSATIEGVISAMKGEKR